MENLRWILIFAGVAILVLLYFSGRSRRTPTQRDVLNKSRGPHPNPQAQAPDPLMGDGDAANSHGSTYTDGYRHQDPATGGRGNPSAPQGQGFDDQFGGFGQVDPDDFERPAGGPVGRGAQAPGVEQAGYTAPAEDRAQPATSGLGLGTISQKIESFGERLSPKRRSRVAASEPADETAQGSNPKNYATKIVTLHVVAPPQQMFDGSVLLGLFEQHGYHFGDMNIFHSMHEGKKVFSIAKLVEPGYFDIDRVESFHTPGISMILQLPGPVPADVAFEVLVSEAFDLAAGLGGTVLDADRSTLSKQTVQHMREDIYEYMHRQKYFSGVPS